MAVENLKHKPSVKYELPRRWKSGNSSEKKLTLTQSMLTATKVGLQLNQQLRIQYLYILTPPANQLQSLLNCLEFLEAVWNS
jgi:hypothetical protein